MTTKTQRDKEKKQQEEFQAILRRLLLEEDNKYCADCDAKGPRWASWNIGVFLCIRCAGIHRNLGVHISKVKSVNLDTWTEKQILSIDSRGNRCCREVYEAKLPASFRRPQTDSPLEHFIRAKYEHKKYTDMELEKKLLARTPAPRIEPEKEKKKSSSSSSQKSVTLQKIAKVPGPTAPMQSPSRARPAPIDAGAFQQTKAPGVVNSAPSTPPKVQSSMDDLLGLDTPKVNNNDDLFGLSAAPSGASLAPGPQLVASASAPSLTSLVPQAATNGVANDVDLFGPPESTAASTTSGQTSKESILALFGSQPSTQQQMYNVPGGLYIPSQQPNQQQPMMMNQQQSQGYQQGMMGMQATQQGMMGMHATQQGMTGMHATQQGMMGMPGAQQQGMMGMPNQQGMMGVNMGYGVNPMQQQQAYLQQFQSDQGFSPQSTNNSANKAQPQQSPLIPAQQPTNTMHMQQQPYMHMQHQLPDTNTLWQQHMYNPGSLMNNQQPRGHSMSNQQVMNSRATHGPLMNNQQAQRMIIPQPYGTSHQGASPPGNLIQTSAVQQGGVTSHFMQMHQPDVNQIQAQMQNMRVGGNQGQMTGTTGQQMNGQATMNGQIPQQQQAWNAGMFPSMQQAQGVPVQGNAGWSSGNMAGQTLSTQLWK